MTCVKSLCYVCNCLFCEKTPIYQEYGRMSTYVNDAKGINSGTMTAQILIVDDDTGVRSAMEEFLSMFDYTTHTAGSAEAALEFLKTRSVDVIITDIILNGMDGLEMTRRVKEHYDTDVIVVTGYTAEYSYEEAVSKGADDFIFKPLKFEELLLRLKRVLRERELTRERSQMLEKLRQMAITDDLTQLYNSRHFYDQLQQEISRFDRYHHCISLLLIDIDHFKYFNDSYGHLEGDRILHQMGGLITSCLRKMDTAYRYGGEEFTVILPETPCDAAYKVAERIHETVGQQLFDSVNGDRITVSIGVTEYQPGESMNEFIKRADQAMYIAKGKGRNRISSLLPDQPQG